MQIPGTLSPLGYSAKNAVALKDWQGENHAHVCGYFALPLVLKRHWCQLRRSLAPHANRVVLTSRERATRSSKPWRAIEYMIRLRSTQCILPEPNPQSLNAAAFKYLRAWLGHDRRRVKTTQNNQWYASLRRGKRCARLDVSSEQRYAHFTG